MAPSGRLHNNHDDSSLSNSNRNSTTSAPLSTDVLEQHDKSPNASNLMLESSPHENNQNSNNTDQKNHTTRLILIFLAFVITGALYTVSSKLQAITMYNYPNFLNVWGCLLYVPLCFLYIIPAVIYQYIPPEQSKASKRPFVIMAIFDTLSSTMVTFASIYLPGPFLVLLPQAAIPVTMALSKFYLKSSYGVWQYVGSIVVILGIVVVLEPVLTNRHAPDYVCVALDEVKDCVVCQDYMTREHCEGFSSSPSEYYATNGSSVLFQLGGEDTSTATQTCRWIESSHETSGTSTLILWSFILLLSCVPQSISSIYKEQKLNEIEWDPVYLNGWIALYQVPMSTILAVPGGLLSSPPIPPMDLPANFWDGMKCFVGQETVTTGCHPDTYCRYAMLAMCTSILLCFIFSNLMVLLLKYSSANLMFLALTCIVPLGNLSFALPFMPGRVALHASDLIGLVVIMIGIVSYRFGSVLCGEKVVEEDETEVRDIETNDLNEPLLSIEDLGMEVEAVDEDYGLSR